MGSFLADCMSSLEQIRQQAAGSLVEQHAPFCHRRDDWEESSITAFVKALSQGGWAANDCFAKAGDRALGYIWAFSWGAGRDLGTGHERDCAIRMMAKCKVFWNRGDTRKKLTKCVMTDVSFSDCCFLAQRHTVGLGGDLLRLDCVPLPPHWAGAMEGEGKQEIYVLLWHTLL